MRSFSTYKSGLLSSFTIQNKSLSINTFEHTTHFALRVMLKSMFAKRNVLEIMVRKYSKLYSSTISIVILHRKLHTLNECCIFYTYSEIYLFIRPFCGCLLNNTALSSSSEYADIPCSAFSRSSLFSSPCCRPIVVYLTVSLDEGSEATIPPFLENFGRSDKVKWTSLKACNRNIPETIVPKPEQKNKEVVD